MNFNRNVGSIDKNIRLLAGIVLLGWAMLGAGLASTAGIVAAIVGAILLFTGVMNFCPLFKLLGVSSYRHNDG